MKNKIIIFGVLILVLLVNLGGVRAVSIYAEPSEYNHTFYLYERNAYNLTQSHEFKIILKNNDNVTYNDINFTSNYTTSYSPEGFMLHSDGNGNFTFYHEIEMKNLDEHENETIYFEMNITGYYEEFDNVTNETTTNYLVLKTIPFYVNIVSYLESESIYHFKKCTMENDAESCAIMNATNMNELIKVICEEHKDLEACGNLTILKNTTIEQIDHNILLTDDFVREVLGDDKKNRAETVEILKTIQSNISQIVLDNRQFWLEEMANERRLKNQVNEVRTLLMGFHRNSESKEWYLVNRTKLQTGGRIEVEEGNVNEVMIALALNYEDYQNAIRELSSEIEMKTLESVKIVEDVKITTVEYYITHKSTADKIQIQRDMDSRDFFLVVFVSFLIFAVAIVFLFVAKTKKGSKM